MHRALFYTWQQQHHPLSSPSGDRVCAMLTAARTSSRRHTDPFAPSALAVPEVLLIKRHRYWYLTVTANTWLSKPPQPLSPIVISLYAEVSDSRLKDSIYIRDAALLLYWHDTTLDVPGLWWSMKRADRIVVTCWFKAGARRKLRSAGQSLLFHCKRLIHQRKQLYGTVRYVAWE